MTLLRPSHRVLKCLVDCLSPRDYSEHTVETRGQTYEGASLGLDGTMLAHLLLLVLLLISVVCC